MHPADHDGNIGMPQPSAGLHLARRHPYAERDRSEEAMSRMGTRVTVVVADDHPFYRDGVTRGLTHSGQVQVVAEAENGREALDAIRRERPDVALVDYQMPDLDGVEIVHAVIRDQLPTR